MPKWSKEQRRFVGRVIFANFLELPLERYKNFIEEAEQSLYCEGGSASLVTVKHLSKAKLSRNKANKSSKVIAEIVKTNSGFSIGYTYEGFNKIYIRRGISQSRLFYKLRRISSRNELSHRILEGIIEYQKDFLTSGSAADLKPFNQAELVKWLKQKQFKADISWTSRLVNRISVITSCGEERILKSFFQTQKDINKRLIKQLLDKENEDIESGKLKNPLTDKQVGAKLKKEYGPSLSRCTVGHYRKDMGIPSSKRRLSGYKYPPLSANFSLLYPLTKESAQNNAPGSPGVYEIRLRSKEIDYHQGRTNVFYIGSAKNIKKRIKEHLRPNNKNGGIRDFIKRFDCCFRYIQFLKNWQEEERELYELFVTTYGRSPKCNSVRP